MLQKIACFILIGLWSTSSWCVSIYNYVSDKPHQMMILNKGSSALQKRLDMIANAKDSIDVEYFIYNADLAGKLMTQALLKRAKEGIKVRMLLDHFSVGSTITPYHYYELKKAGIQVRYFNTAPLIRIVKAQFRNHRKALIVDNSQAIIGGRNIGDEYFDLREDYNYMDRDLWIEGEIVPIIRKSFDVIWNSGLVDTVRRRKRPERRDLRYRRANRGSGRSRNRSNYERDLREWKKNVRAAKLFMYETEKERDILRRMKTLSFKSFDLEPRGICHKTTFSTDKFGPIPWGAKDKVLKHVIFNKLKNVGERAIVDSPYFIMNEEMDEALNHILTNNKKLSLLTNSLYSTDALYVASAFNDIIRKWIRRGLKAHIYSGDVQKGYPTLGDYISSSRWGTHSKSIVFDDDAMMIGSYNFDPRSNYFSSELAVFCEDSPLLAKALEENIVERMENSIHLDTAEKVSEVTFDRIGFLKRLGYYAIKIPASLLDFLL